MDKKELFKLTKQSKWEIGVLQNQENRKNLPPKSSFLVPRIGSSFAYIKAKNNSK